MHFPEEFKEPLGPGEFGARFGAHGVSGLSVLWAEVGRAGLSPAQLCPWGTAVCAAPQQSWPAAGFDRLFSSVLQLMAQAQPPACLWGPLAELKALRHGQGDPACPCLRPLFFRLSALPVATCSCLVVVRCLKFPFCMIPGSAAGPGSPRSRLEVLALLGRDPWSPEVQRHHPDQSLHLPSVCLRVFHGTSPAAGPSGVLWWE